MAYLYSKLEFITNNIQVIHLNSMPPFDIQLQLHEMSLYSKGSRFRINPDCQLQGWGLMQVWISMTRKIVERKISLTWTM